MAIEILPSFWGKLPEIMGCSVLSFADEAEPVAQKIFNKLDLAYMEMLMECESMPKTTKKVNNYERMTIAHVTMIMKKQQIA